MPVARPLSLPLFPEEAAPRRVEAPLPPPRIFPKQLWMAVHLPRLSLQALGIQPSSREPLALLEGEGRRLRILDCTAGAAALGVQPGQPLNSARALAPGLQTRPREAAREQAALLKLAECGHGFTPTVSLESPASLLLEVEGSAHLFGGPETIRERARQAFAAQGFSAALAVAPTPLAALWLAKAGVEITATSLDELRSTLGRLPLQAVTCAADATDAFQRLGLRQLADLLRLPRDGLAKRFGPEFLHTLDQALGLAPDPRGSWQAPRRCRLSRELPGEFTSLDHLQPHIEELVAALCRELRAYDAGADRLRLLFKHWRQSPTVMTVGSAEPCCDPKRWNTLLQAQLADCRLTSSVHELQLLSGRLRPFTATNAELLGSGSRPGDPLGKLVDLLRARLGHSRVFGLVATTDARPERSWRRVEPGTALDARPTPVRPIQLLAQPLPLEHTGGVLRHRDAALKLTRGPERIEGGWWDGETWIRDYYQAVSSRGSLLWVFQERNRWFLHGFFA
jgi:protein ImuB